jgi:hypothetical protein
VLKAIRLSAKLPLLIPRAKADLSVSKNVKSVLGNKIGSKINVHRRKYFSYPEQFPTPMLLFQDPNMLWITIRGIELGSVHDELLKAIARCARGISAFSTRNYKS